MKLSKNPFIIITTIAIFILCLGLTYGINRLRSSSGIKIPEVINEQIKLTPEPSDKLAVYDNLKIEEKIYKSSSVFKVNNSKIPILMYHSISYEKGNSLRLSKENFRMQMKYLKDNNYTTLTVDELYSYMQTGKMIPDKPIIITFDDGYKDNYTNAYPILKELGLKATVFVITGAIDTEKDFLTSDEIKFLDSNNIRIESHTVAHEHLDKISYSDNIKTMTSSKAKLEKILNRKINYLAYPYGGYTEDTIKAAKESGYKLAFSTDMSWINKNNNIYSLGRIFVNANFSFNEFKVKLNP
ncbi:polysaccharide deacetylase family protein [Clostridium estertheticum]|uniref:polysaccharide deacetylase family protein n=1 Tax=Clostridium estertheticum TaxID=238834 RepID=UPI0013E9680A|nr:polysaccharide deacetylase family protein [Clostridium estertheticum]MBZ9687147.1 polysaccharide deacetylase family protein [Clostridium estertheticum]